jgi:UDP-2-acetamido-3-amino-2,3-dideoxy-glucuronate N-acetyltransferase
MIDQNRGGKGKLMKPTIGVIGCGSWGKNLVRNFNELNALKAICDINQKALQAIQDKYPAVQAVQDHRDLIQDSTIKAVVISTPAATHYELAKEALLAEKDVFVEKPIALVTKDAQELVALAKDKKKVLMVGHILEYHAAINKLKELIDHGALGKIHYIYSTRLNLGKFRTEENILWSFAPHDISAILYLLNEMPTQVAAHGGNYLNPNITDVTVTNMDFPSGARAHIFVSWLHPYKEQKLVVIGDKKMMMFDDVEPKDKLFAYSHKIDWIDRLPVPHPEKPERIENGSVRRLGSGEEKKYFVHETAVVDDHVEIGDGTKTWHFSHVQSGSRIGKSCVLGQNVNIANNVTIGNFVKIQNNVSVYEGVTLEDFVFCGPSMVFTNITDPRSKYPQAGSKFYKKTLVKEGASLGANCTILCGLTIGRFAFVGAGAVVTKNVPDYALVVGNPATIVGWMSEAGRKLVFNRDGYAFCEKCRKTYKLENGSVKEVADEPQPNIS